jgi:hypothetical protein
MSDDFSGCNTTNSSAFCEFVPAGVRKEEPRRKKVASASGIDDMRNRMRRRFDHL